MAKHFPVGALVLVDGRDKARVAQAFPEGSSSFLFPHYKVHFEGGDQNVAVAMSRVGVEKKLSVGKGMNRRVTKAGLAAGEKFKAMVEEKLEELGAKRSPVPIDVPEGETFTGPCVRCGKRADCACVVPEGKFEGGVWIDRHGPFSYVPYDERKRDWSIETRHGKLWLTVYAEDTWIAGLWDDWPRAQAAGMDHWKWNHHYHLTPADQAAAHFIRQLRSVL